MLTNKEMMLPVLIVGLIRTKISYWVVFLIVPLISAPLSGDELLPVRLCSSRMEVVSPSNAARLTFENSRLGVVTEAAEKSRADCCGMKLIDIRMIVSAGNPTAATFICVHSGMEGLKSRFQMGYVLFEVFFGYGLDG